jgi:hypothetical protein
VGVGVGVVGAGVVGVGVLDSVGGGVGVGVGVVTRTGCSVLRVGACGTGVVAGALGRNTGGVLVGSPPLPNGLSNTSTINATGIAMIAAAASGRGPPYLPIGPRTGRLCLSTQNVHPSGAAGQAFGGCHRRGGRQSGVGGSGHSGGVLNCLTASSQQAP